MKTARTGKAVPPRRTLTQLAAAGETGALHVEGEPGGVLYLKDGWVSYVESPGSPGVGELLTTSGRLPAVVWEAAAASGEDVGPLLVAQGHLTQGELELCTLGAIYDAAFFVLSPAPARIRFEAGERHWLGPVCQVDAAVLARELTRRRKLLDDAHPSSDVDTGRLRATPRAPTPRLVVTAPQWELIVHCDGHRTASDLARLLGRAGYTTLLELRRLVAAGLVIATPPEQPKPDEGGAGPPAEEEHLTSDGAPHSEKAVGRAPVTKGDSGGPEPSASEASAAKPGPAAKPAARAARDKGNGASAARRTSGSRRAVAATPPTGGRPAQAEARLPRRTPGEQMSGPDPPLALGDEPDEALLSRIRSGLQAL
ncbi:DUF4388 domain-containing protein [Phytohabitans houttuyneae]|uniref:PatA-like N-terminal domain-containing protein n=1 Tax=Phytohabitans houttuyneae TaxID=1076126 RepID=A0A6V8KU49_9ACTN|nr:DUF4388 domain-containing protein [Phytohabitans houttuyneae]GFJ85347.1 hypothetical protein Phou_095270 [Phytohabitans houttuyneae]